MMKEKTVEVKKTIELFKQNTYKKKQAGTGPSRRHIQGSKTAKRLPSVKYSFTVPENRNFLKNFSKKLHTQETGPSGAPGALKSHNAEKLKGGPFVVF